MPNPVDRARMIRWSSVLLACAAGLAGCGGPPPQSSMSIYAGQAKTSRATAASAMAAGFTAGQFTAEEAINAAHDRLEAGEDATDFAGAVLDMLVIVQDKLPQRAEFELFWMRIGQLAFRAALMAHNKGRLNEAYELVFAGPDRWQTEHYWLMSPNHDALASMILDEHGEHGKALTRLGDRSNLEGAALEVYEKLTNGKRGGS